MKLMQLDIKGKLKILRFDTSSGGEKEI